MSEASERLYEVKGGDTLWSISQNELGSVLRWPELYRANRETINAEIRKRGIKSVLDVRSFHPEDWIWPGQVLKIPAALTDGGVA